MAQIITPKYLESLRSSDYKNSMYAFAEIIDNSIDAESSYIEIIFKTTLTGRKSIIEDVFFVDNGIGIPHLQLDRVVIFSVSGNVPGSGDKKTGRFGVGLPNSSLSQTKNFSVASKDGQNIWATVAIDLGKMIANDSLEVPIVDEGLNAHITYVLSKTIVPNPRTIVHWKKPDQLDFSNPTDFYPKFEPLIGRIYRYFLKDDIVKIRLSTFENGNDPTFRDIRAYDPLFLLEGKSIVYDFIQEDIKRDYQGDSKIRPKEYLKGFLDISQKIVKPLFQKLDSHSAVDLIKVKFQGREYKLSMTSAYAFKDIQKPGMNKPGSMKGLGQTMQKKMVGGKYGPGGNISWVRNGREIDCGNYNLFTIGEEKNRWWSIEISYDTEGDTDHVLDKMLGLSNTKQSFKFKAVSQPHTIDVDTESLSVARAYLMANLTVQISDAIKVLRQKLAVQASQYAREIEPENPDLGGFPGPQPGTSRVLLDALGPGEKLTVLEKAELSKSLAGHLPDVPKVNIENAVERYSEIGIRNIPIYCQLHPNVFFEAQRFRGRVLTLINTEHPFYKKIIQPLKENGSIDLIVSTELLISTLTKSSIESPENQQSALNSYHSKISNTLADLLTLQEATLTPEDGDDADLD